jgi:hypothetical protein
MKLRPVPIQCFISAQKTWSSGPGQRQMALPWSFVSKNTNPKHQITNKSQIPIFNDQNLPRGDIVWILEFRSLEVV